MIYDIIIVTPFYKRENIFKIFLKHLKKKQRRWYKFTCYINWFKFNRK